MTDERNENAAGSRLETERRPELPGAWAARLESYALAIEDIGCSGAVVYCLEAPGRPPLFLKTEPAGPFAELPAEWERLSWLGTLRVPSPQVLGHVEELGRHWLLMTALPGRDLASTPDLPPKGVVALAAAALRDLHGREASRCPFDHRLDQRLKVARARMEAGVVDESDFDEESLGRSASELFDELLALRPPDEDLVLTHGDACLPNLIAEKDRFTGFVDCGRAGLADRHQDLALAARSISSNLGAEWAESFLRVYGGPVDRQRLAYYRLLDEFF